MNIQKYIEDGLSQIIIDSLLNYEKLNITDYISTEYRYNIDYIKEEFHYFPEEALTEIAYDGLCVVSKYIKKLINECELNNLIPYVIEYPSVRCIDMPKNNIIRYLVSYELLFLPKEGTKFAQG